ncbi:hypothetical protein [Salinispira pacifica]
MAIYRICALLVFFLVSTACAPAQQSSGSSAAGGGTPGSPGGGSASASAQPAPGGADIGPLALPRGFEDLLLGLPIDEIKKRLAASPYFQYRGDPDVSLSPLDKQPIIESSGVRFVSSGIFQFHDQRLYTITINLNRSLLDFYSMFTSLSAKYGEPASLSPSEVVWENDQVRLSLEKPLTIKYIDRVVFNQLKEAGQAQKSLQELSREEFIHLF